MPGDLARDSAHSDSGPLRFLRRTLQTLLLAKHHHPNPFADRFKHDVISSSLLSSTPFATPQHQHHRTGSPALLVPGSLHSRDPSIQDAHHPQLHSRKPTATDSSNYWLAGVAFALAVVIFTAGYYTLTALLLGGTFYFIHFHHPSADLSLNSNTNAMSPVSSTLSLATSDKFADFSYSARGRVWKL